MWESEFTKNASQIAERHFLEVPSEIEYAKSQGIAVRYLE